jgi:hypothetical protein
MELSKECRQLFEEERDLDQIGQMRLAWEKAFRRLGRLERPPPSGSKRMVIKERPVELAPKRLL